MAPSPEPLMRPSCTSRTSQWRVFALWLCGASLTGASTTGSPDVDIGATSCPPGEGLPTESSLECEVCGKGSWSDGETIDCVLCAPGRWYDFEGATSAAACKPCPRGTWSDEVGAGSRDSCRSCPAGRWGAAEGLAQESECTACPPGTWNSQRGATSSGACLPCPEGTWSELGGAPSRSSCVRCPAGTWSNATGLSSEAGCSKCPAGTWSSDKGLTTSEECTACELGTHASIGGQAAESACEHCAPGRFGLVPGAPNCASCPAGTWSSNFGETACTACPRGTTAGREAVSESECTPCHDPTCHQGQDLPVNFELRGLARRLAGLSEAEHESVSKICARLVAAAANVEPSQVVDLHHRPGHVTLHGHGGIAAAHVKLRQGGRFTVSPQEIVVRLRSPAFARHVFSRPSAASGAENLIETISVLEALHSVDTWDEASTASSFNIHSAGRFLSRSFGDMSSFHSSKFVGDVTEAPWWLALVGLGIGGAFALSCAAWSMRARKIGAKELEKELDAGQHTRRRLPGLLGGRSVDLGGAEIAKAGDGPGGAGEASPVSHEPMSVRKRGGSMRSFVELAFMDGEGTPIQGASPVPSFSMTPSPIRPM